jgi:uncharacterized protein (TIGR02466 family)
MRVLVAKLPGARRAAERARLQWPRCVGDDARDSETEPGAASMSNTGRSENASRRLIFPLFATPVYINNVGEFTKPDVKALEYSSSLADGGAYPFASSVDKNVLQRAEYKAVHDLCLREVNSYAREVLGVSSAIEFYITNSWVNIHGRGQSAGSHVHNNSLLSGVLYLKVTETTGDIVFHRNELSLIPFPPALDLDIATINIYNCKSWGYRPKTNDICLFPSTVAHSADPNASDQERWCLAFNVFVRGDIGSLHKISLR